jgi:hypothetical protein
MSGSGKDRVGQGKGRVRRGNDSWGRGDLTHGNVNLKIVVGNQVVVKEFFCSCVFKSNSSFGLNQKNQKFKAVKKLAKIYSVSLNKKNSPNAIGPAGLEQLFVFNAPLHKFFNAIFSRPNEAKGRDLKTFYL